MKTVLPFSGLPKELACRRPGPRPSRRAACGHCGDGLSVNFNFFKLNAVTVASDISKRAVEMTFASHMALSPIWSVIVTVAGVPLAA